jgi:glycosyltransferase involved in cell wall biosynthesis
MSAGGRRLARSLFLVWAPPHKGPRSARFAAGLGVPVYFLADRWRQGLRDPLKYPRLLWRTTRTLMTRRPRLVLVQSPPSLATWTVALYAMLTGAAFVIDAHSDAFQRARWTRPRWLNRAVQRRALAVVVTDEHWARTIREAGGRAIVIPDIPTTPASDGPLVPAAERFTILVVNTWADDEPLAAVVAAGASIPDADFEITGTADERVVALGPLPPNVRFTGFLPEAEYYARMAAAHAVLCLTDRDHTMQRGACEALSLGRPIITSDWPLLRSYFEGGTVHVDSSVSGIADGIRHLMAHYGEHAAGILELRATRLHDWDTRRDELMDLFASAEAGVRAGRGSR